MTHRSAVEEWQPHAKQTDFSQEWWWYTTAFFHDAKGQLYSLMFTDFKQDGKKVPILMSNPQLVPLLRPDTTITHYLLGFSNYDTGYRNPNAGLVVNNVSQLWQPKTNALNYDCKGITG